MLFPNALEFINVLWGKTMLVKHVGSCGDRRELGGYKLGYAGMWGLFFTMWGPMCIAERVLLSVLRKNGLVPPSWISVPLTLVLSLAWGHACFFPVMKDPILYDPVYRMPYEVLNSALSFWSPIHWEL
jgi:hypothetical protein